MSTEHESSDNDFVPVNQVLNLKPRLGPIPGEQAGASHVVSYQSYLTNST